MPRPPKEQPNRKDGLYEVKITTGKTFNGKLVRKSFYSSISKSDARRQAEQYKIDMAAAERAGITLIEDINFEKWSNIWLEKYKKGKVKDNTYRGSFENPVKKHLIPHFGRADLKDIKPVDVQVFFDLKANIYAQETLKKMRSCLSAIFDTAIENDLCIKNPVTKNIKIKSNITTSEKRAYSTEQRKTVLKFAENHPSGLPITLMLKTGITRSELLGLMWEDIDIENRILHIHRGVADEKDTTLNKWIVTVGGLKNKYRERSIPIDIELAEALGDKERTLSIGGNKKKKIPPLIITPDFIFPNSKGEAFSPSNWSLRVYDKFMSDMNEAHPDVPILGAHELRHTYATYLKDKGVDLFSIAKILGHVDLDMLSKRYAHNNIETLRKALGI